MYNLKTDLEELLAGFRWEVIGLLLGEGFASEDEFLRYWRAY